MALDFLLFAAVVGAGAWAIRERNRRIETQGELGRERMISETLGRALAQTRSRLEVSERTLADLGDGPAPRSEQRLRRIK